MSQITPDLVCSPHSWLPLAAGTRARAGAQAFLAGAAYSHPCSGQLHAQSPWTRCVTGFPEVYSLTLAPHSRSGSLLDGCVLSLQLEQECLAPLLKLLCFRRAKRSQLLPQLMGAAVRAQHSWKSSLQLHSWE